MKSLILLVPAGDVQRGLVGSALRLRQHERAVRRTEQTVRAGNHLERISRLLLARVMYQDQAQPVAIGKAFQPGNDVVIARIAVRLAADLPYLLQCVDDNEPGIRVLLDKALQLLIQSFSELPCMCGEKELIRDLHIEHLIHSSLQALVIVLQRHVQNRSFSHRKIPQRRTGADMERKLCDQEALTDFGRADQQIGSRKEQVVDQRRLALIRGFV